MQPITLAFMATLCASTAVLGVLGDRWERRVAAAQFAAYFATLFLRGFQSHRFLHLSTAITIVDIAVLVAVTAPAIRTRRPWMIATSSLLTFPPLGHFAKLVDPGLWTGGYWLLTNLPALPCVAILAVRSWLTIHRWRNARSISRPC